MWNVSPRLVFVAALLLLSVSGALALSELQLGVFFESYVGGPSHGNFAFTLPAFNVSAIKHFTVQFFRTGVLSYRTPKEANETLLSKMTLRREGKEVASADGQIIYDGGRDTPVGAGQAYSLEVWANPTFSFTYSVRYCLGDCENICFINSTSTKQACSGHGSCYTRFSKCDCDLGLAFHITGHDCGVINDRWIDPGYFHLIISGLAFLGLFGFFAAVSLVCYSNRCDSCFHTYEPERVEQLTVGKHD